MPGPFPLKENREKSGCGGMSSSLSDGMAIGSREARIFGNTRAGKMVVELMWASDSIQVLGLFAFQERWLTIGRRQINDCGRRY